MQDTGYLPDTGFMMQDSGYLPDTGLSSLSGLANYRRIDRREYELYRNEIFQMNLTLF